MPTHKGIERKVRWAFSGMPLLEYPVIDSNLCPKKGTIEYHVNFDYQGVNYRWDYEWSFGAPLPYVKDLRLLIWNSLKEYRREPGLD